MAATSQQDQNASQAMPVVFTLPGMAADTCLQVFDQAFHVHSAILTIHSAFFRKFLNSADKAPAMGVLFSYEYKTRIDGDGMWGLEASSKIAEEYTATSLTGTEIDISGETDAFHKLLCAIYNRPYRVENTEQLSKMTRLADFYCALPTLSSSLNTILWDTQGFVKDIPANARILLPLAYKLRHPIFFQECMIHVVGSLGNSDSKLFNNPALDNLVTLHYCKLCERIAITCFMIFRAGRGSFYLNDEQRRTLWDILYGHSHDLPLQENALIPSSSFFYKLYNNNDQYSLGITSAVRECITPLLKNNLRLDLSSGQIAKDRFLCTEITAADLPWDCTENDW